tara:strand:+ start:867 stop:1073 length:207 start_codon:yes stop_codon:yes gene_type:complete
MTTAPLQQAPALKDLREKLTNSLFAYSASCHEIRKVLVRDFGYTVKEANEFINDIVRDAYGFLPQGQS